MSIFTISLRIWVVDPTVIEKPNGRGRKAPLSTPSSCLTYKVWDLSVFMAWPLPNSLVSPQKFLSLPSLMPASPCFPLSPAGWAGFQMHFPRTTSRGKTSKTARFPEHHGAASALNQGNPPIVLEPGRGRKSSHYEKTKALGMRFRAGLSGYQVISP